MKIIIASCLAMSLLLLLLAAVSCSQLPRASATTHTALAAVNPCALLTKDEAAAAIGEQVGAPTEENNNPDLLCTYANAATEHSISVTTNTGMGAKKAFRMVNELSAHDMIVNDLGDSAFIDKLRGIHVIAGDSYFAIRIKDDSPMALPKIEGANQPPGSTELPQATRDKLTALARKAVSRL